MRLLRYPGWLPGCCFAVGRGTRVVARLPGAVARLLLCGC